MPAEPPAAPPSPPDDDALWVPQVDADVIEPFLEEAAERTEALSQKLLRLESAPGDVELVREIFRDLHTIKGSSAFVGLRRMNLLAHAAEDLVGQLRNGTRAANRPVIDALLGALDALRAILHAATGVDATNGARIDVPMSQRWRGCARRAPGARRRGRPLPPRRRPGALTALPVLPAGVAAAAAAGAGVPPASAAAPPLARSARRCARRWSRRRRWRRAGSRATRRGRRGTARR